MDAIKILGELLGNKQMSRGSGQQILETILGGGGGGVLGGGQPQPQRTPQPQHMPQPTHTQGRSPADIMRGGGGGQGVPMGNNPLGGLIRSAVEGFMKQHGGEQPQQRGHGHGHGHEHGREHGREHRHEQRREPTAPSAGPCPTGFPDDREEANRQAQVLIRAMINAAKADGRIDQKEQENIVSRMGHLSQDEIQFLRHEFAQPLDVPVFVREVPRGLEDEVYAISLTAIDLDTNPEARYLHELAHGLGLSHDQCNQIHTQFGAPRIFA